MKSKIKLFIGLCLCLVLAVKLHGQAARIIYDHTGSYTDIKAIDKDEVFSAIVEGLAAAKVKKDTSVLKVRFSLRRAFGSLTEESNYQPHQGENYKHTWGPPSGFKNDKTRKTYVEKFEVTVLDRFDEIVGRSAYGLEINIKVPVNEKVKKQILKRITISSKRITNHKK